MYSDKAQYNQALEYYTQSLTIRREIGDRVGEAITVQNMGHMYTDMGQYDQAQEFFKRALIIARELGLLSEEKEILEDIDNLPDNP